MTIHPISAVMHELKIIFVLKIPLALTGDVFNIQNLNPSPPILLPATFIFIIPETSKGNNKKKRVSIFIKKLISLLLLVSFEIDQKNIKTSIISGISNCMSLLKF